MSKKRSLSVALNEVSPRLRPGDAKPAMTPPSTSRPPARQGKCQIAGFFDPAASKQLKKLALETDSNVQQLLREALNDLFEKHGLSRIA